NNKCLSRSGLSLSSCKVFLKSWMILHKKLSKSANTMTDKRHKLRMRYNKLELRLKKKEKFALRRGKEEIPIPVFSNNCTGKVTRVLDPFYSIILMERFVLNQECFSH